MLLTILEIIGWIGAMMYLGAYFVYATNIMPSRRQYYFLNIIAAACVIAASLGKNSFQLIFINIFWILISIAGYRSLTVPPWFQAQKPARFINGSVIIAGLVTMAIGQIGLGADILAWGGALSFVLSYLVFAANRIGWLEFNIWNFMGASALVPQLYLAENWPGLTLEISWACIAAYSAATHRHTPNKVGS